MVGEVQYGTKILLFHEKCAWEENISNSKKKVNQNCAVNQTERDKAAFAFIWNVNINSQQSLDILFKFKS